jgi:hypothetical protein
MVATIGNARCLYQNCVDWQTINKELNESVTKQSFTSGTLITIIDLYNNLELVYILSWHHTLINMANFDPKPVEEH